MAQFISPTEIENTMHEHCQLQLDLCEKLEILADSLPHRIDTLDCFHLARILYPELKSSHNFEEQQLFPALAPLTRNDRALAASLERLLCEHWEDESYSQELTDTLTDWAKGRHPRNPEASGYMLRGFFEGLRRHIAFEREHIVPMLRKLDCMAEINSVGLKT